jgi:septal ring-binding cell division protein DamX
VRRKWAAFIFLSLCIAGYTFAAGSSDFPEASVTAYDAGSGIARIAIDWKKVRPDDERQFGLYRSTGEKADVYSLLTTLPTSMTVYTDSGLDVDTEYHYIIGGALPRKTLPQTKARKAKERRAELSHPQAAVSYGKLSAGPIAWLPPETLADQAQEDMNQAAGNTPPPSQTGGTQPYIPPTQMGGTQPYVSPGQMGDSPLYVPPPQMGGSPLSTEMPPVFPYHEPVGNFTVPIQEPAFENGGVFFSMGYFSNRVFELAETASKPAVISLIDNSAKSRLVSLFNQSYGRSSLPGTSLYYAIHSAINRITSWDVNGALSKFDTVLLVTITDGLDTSSTDTTLEPIDGLSFKNAASYQDFIKKTLESKQTGGKKITAVSIGIQGTDTITETDYEITLRSVASADHNVYRIPLRNLTKTLQNIAAPIADGMAEQPFGFITPAYPDGTEIFIALDGFSTPMRGQNFIAGKLKVTGNQPYLENITLGGLAKEASSAPNGGIAGQVEPNGGIEWKFNFSETLNPSKVVLYYKTGKDWHGTKEFAVRTYAPASSNRSALVYLLIDNSVSMSDQNIAAIRESVTNFIDALSVNRAHVQPLFSSNAALTMERLRERSPDPALAAVSPPPPEPRWERSLLPEVPSSEMPFLKTPSSETPLSEKKIEANGADAGFADAWFRPVPDLTPGTNLSPIPALPETSLSPTAAPPKTSLSPIAAPPKTNTPIIPSASVPQPVSGGKGYWVQASSSNDRTAAEGVISLLRQYQLFPVITEARLQGKTFYRVRLGPYATLADASIVAEFVKNPPLGFYDSFIP